MSTERPRGGTARSHCQDTILDDLIAAGRLQEDDLRAARAVATHDREERSLVYHLVDLKRVTSEEICAHLARLWRFPASPVEALDTAPDAASLLDAAVARELGVAPLRLEGANRLHVVVRDPYDTTVPARIEELTRREVVAHLTDDHSLLRYLDAVYASWHSLHDAIQRTAQRGSPTERGPSRRRVLEFLAGEVADLDGPALFRGMMTDAIKRGASDVHLEQFDGWTRLRYRIDGLLTEVTRDIPPHLGPEIIKHVKAIGGMDNAQDRTADDGQIPFKYGDEAGRTADLRISTVPAVYGEKVAIRILNQHEVKLDLEPLGFVAEERQLLREEIEKPEGMILLSGPTGSGKTTTMHALIGRLNTQERHIITAEDPVERRIPGITQMEVTRQFSFDAALEAIVRQDPDVIMIGEMRSRATADATHSAAITGRLVLSSTHARDSVSTITRLTDLGVAPGMIVSAVNVVIAQRLVRRLCTAEGCRERYQPSEDEVLRSGLTLDEADGIDFFRSRGCPECTNGYRGRVGIYEILRVTPGIRKLIRGMASEEVLRATAREEGSISLRRAGIRLVSRGVTTLDEIRRVTILQN